MDQEADLFAGVSCSKYKERFGFGCLDDATIAKVRKALNDEVLPRHLSFFESLLARSSSGWLADTPGPSCADFLLGPRLHWLASGAVDGISTTILDAFPKVKDFVARFYALPAVAAVAEASK
jgi:glutathione S-transferase